MLQSGKQRVASLENLKAAARANLLRFARQRNTSVFRCRQCGADTYAKRCHLPLRTYCSMVCMAEAYKQRLRGTANPNFRDAARRWCLYCGTEFRHYDKMRKYCSHDCYLKNMPQYHRCRQDRNHLEIVDGLRALGVGVLDMSELGQGLPDIVAGVKGRTVLIEIKNAANSYGRQGLTRRQARWAREWKGSSVVVASSLTDAVQAVQ